MLHLNLIYLFFLMTNHLSCISCPYKFMQIIETQQICHFQSTFYVLKSIVLNYYFVSFPMSLAAVLVFLSSSIYLSLYPIIFSTLQLSISSILLIPALAFSFHFKRPSFCQLYCVVLYFLLYRMHSVL